MIYALCCQQCLVSRARQVARVLCQAASFGSSAAIVITDGVSHTSAKSHVLMEVRQVGKKAVELVSNHTKDHITVAAFNLLLVHHTYVLSQFFTHLLRVLQIPWLFQEPCKGIGV
eukprot:m.110575 g.110575  ORF g.110575 m.110575 type:complete len:115 (+) comp28052_c0_seq3:137-481(+)